MPTLTSYERRGGRKMNSGPEELQYVDWVWSQKIKKIAENSSIKWKSIIPYFAIQVTVM